MNESAAIYKITKFRFFENDCIDNEELGEIIAVNETGNEINYSIWGDLHEALDVSPNLYLYVCLDTKEANENGEIILDTVSIREDIRINVSSVLHCKNSFLFLNTEEQAYTPDKWYPLNDIEVAV